MCACVCVHVCEAIHLVKSICLLITIFTLVDYCTFDIDNPLSEYINGVNGQLIAEKARTSLTGKEYQKLCIEFYIAIELSS